jgi:hypothetical protein
MSKQLLVDFIPFDITPEMLNEAIKNTSGPFTLKGPLQKAGEKNYNGRVYPKSVLEREIEKYKMVISERRALGELDHPDCHRPTAEILTKDGWKLIKDASVGELVATLNIETDTIEFNPVERIIDQPYNGKMISIKGKNIDVLVTPNHRFVVKDRNGKLLMKTAQEIFDLSKITKNPHLSIPKIATNWSGVEFDTFSIPGVYSTSIAGNRSEEFIKKQTASLLLNSSAWFSFLGFYLAEGHCTDRNSRGGYGIFITQNKGEIANSFREVLSNLSPELEWNETDKGESAIIFSTSDARLWTYLSKLGNKYTKYIPEEIKSASSDLLQNLYDWFVNGDGTVVGEYDRTSVFSVSKQLVEDLYEIVLKLGMTGTIKEQITTKDYMFAGRLVEAKNKSTLYRLWVESSEAIHLDFRFIKIDEVDYNDTVHCVTVKNGTFYCRDQNKAFWSGNSSVINLKNVSHNILECHWEGDTVMGTIEILTTPSGNIARDLIKNNIRIGISSRGLGSTKQVSENTVEVQDDFELLCFDLVSSPSTRGAFMSMNEGVLKEHRQTVITDRKQIDKYLKVEGIVRDILSEIR